MGGLAIGYLGDNVLGRKRVLLLSFAGAGLSYLLVGLADSVGLLYLLWLYLALALTLTLVPTLTLTLTLAPNLTLTLTLAPTVTLTPTLARPAHPLPRHRRVSQADNDHVHRPGETHP